MPQFQLATNTLLVVHNFKFMKFAQMNIDQVIGGVANERTFSTPTFMESKFRHQLFEHTNIAIRMFPQHFFTKNTFPFQVAIVDWNDGNKVKVVVNA